MTIELDSYLANSLSEDSFHFWKNKRVLVTGINGFIGGWLAEGLLNAGAQVVGIVRDNVPGAVIGRSRRSMNLVLLQGSLSEYTLIERALNEYEVDTCFHLAAQAIVGAANRSPLSTFESNIRGTWNLLEACRQSKLIERVAIASSDKAYGVQEELPYTEASELRAIFPYDASKACTDMLARCYATTYGMPVAISRCANIYGGGDLNWNRLVPGTIRSILRRESPIIRSDGTMERDYIHVLDAVRAYLALGRNAAREDVRGEAFNFGSGEPVSVLDVVNCALWSSGRTELQPTILGQGPMPGEIDRQWLDSRKADSVLGWRAHIGMEEGLQQAFGWYEAYLNEVTTESVMRV